MASRTRHRSIIGLALLLAAVSSTARPDALQVNVVDARDRHPIAGAFVMVGPGKGIPFAGNTAVTPPSGTVTFTNPNLVGPQTVTAGADTYAYSAVIESATDSVTLPLYPSVADTSIYGPKARVTGTVTGIHTVNNDGKFDIALVFPAQSVDQFLGTGKVTFEVPPDTANFPIVGKVPVPGDMVMPSQVEFLVLTFSKPYYKIDLPAQTTQTMFAVSARIPVNDILNPPPNGNILAAAEIRQLAVVRDAPVGNGATINLPANHDLHTQLTVQFQGAPLGSRILGASLGSLPVQGGGELVIGYDADYALVDTLDTFLMASSTPEGNIADVQNFVAGAYQDTSAFAAFAAGRIDRTPFSLPATRVLSNFYQLPTLTHQVAAFQWNDVHDPQTEPAPTWALTSISVGPTDPTDTSVQKQLLWRILTPAGAGGFSLPSLPAEAPGPPAGLVDVNGTPQADRLIWDQWIANPSGDLSQVLIQPFQGVTHFSERAVTLDLNPSGAPESGSAPAGLFRIRPNPATGEVHVALAKPLGRTVAIEVIDPQGRRIRSLVLDGRSTEAVWDGRDDQGAPAPPGIYLVRSSDAEAGPPQKLLRLR